MVAAAGPQIDIILTARCLAQADAGTDERLLIERKQIPRRTAVGTLVHLYCTLLLNCNVADIGVLHRIFDIEHHAAEHPLPRLAAVGRAPQLRAVTGKNYIVIGRVEIGHTGAGICSLCRSDVLPVRATIVAYPEYTSCTHKNTVGVGAAYVDGRNLTGHPLAVVTWSPCFTLINGAEDKTCLRTAI